MITQRYECDAKDCSRYTDDEDKYWGSWVDVWIGEEQYVFCSGWCMTKWGATMFEPSEVV